MTLASVRRLSAFASGALFGLGLVVSGMTQPRKVLGFLDVFGAWDPSLLFVMVGAISVHSVAYRLIRGRVRPLAADDFRVPTRRDVDAKLLIGAAVFGVGWGLSGYCPGPSVVSLASGFRSVLVFVGALLLGTFCAILWERARSRGHSETRQVEDAA